MCRSSQFKPSIHFEAHSMAFANLDAHTSLFQSSGLTMHQVKVSFSSNWLSAGHLILRAPEGRDSFDLADFRIVPSETATIVPSHQMNTYKRTPECISQSKRMNVLIGANESHNCLLLSSPFTLFCRPPITPSNLNLPSD